MITYIGYYIDNYLWIYIGACGGETACSTCHVYIDSKFFKKLPELSEAEEDMLDLAAGLKGKYIL